MIRIISSVILIVISGSIAFAQNDEWVTHKKDNYSIEYPSDWELTESGQMGSSFILFSPLSSPDDLFRENVNLIIQDLTGYDLDLDQYVQISTDQVKTMLPNGKMVESERLKGKNSEYQKMIYTGSQGDFNLKFEQYYRVIGNEAYILTFTCEEDKFDEFRETGERILASFSLNMDK